MKNNNKKPVQRGIRHVYYLVVFSTVVTFVYCATIILQSAQNYSRALNDGRDTAMRLAHVVADHAELSLLSANQGLRRAIERQGSQVQQSLAEAPQLVGLALLDARARVVASASTEPDAQWNAYIRSMPNEGLFNYMRSQGDSRNVFIGRHTPKNDGALVVVSRRFDASDGSFAGLAVTGIPADYFSRFYSGVAQGRQKFMRLSLEGGTLLAQGPDDNIRAENAVASLGERSGDNSGTPSVNMAKVDGQLKIVATQRLRSLPVFASVVLDEDDILSDWQAARNKDLRFLLIFLVLGIGLSLFALAMARQMAKAQASEETAILASQAKSDFLANMSHELRTPLNAIIGFSEMMNSGYFGTLNAKQRERLHDIHLCGSHLLQLITDILEFSKGNAGKLELAEEDFSLPDNIREAERMLTARIKAKNIHFTTQLEAGLPLLRADRRKLRQILLNLIGNAIKFTPENGTIRVQAVLDAQGCINLIVTDSGIGIAEEDIPRALSVFGQVHRSRSHEGTGLGLPLCKMYAELHGGKLLLTSKLGVGTTVRITFPRERTRRVT